ncbi:hypothetical protein NK428_000657 [Vibrio navarrensis]|nr:hypothetical protein [Vibrio navarrensis]
MAVRNGKQAILAQFALDGLHHMFGNPGTVEQGFLDALDDYPEIKYILTLHETVAVMAADGYARSTQKPTLVQLHSSPGIGNAVGALYQAKRGHAPLVVIGGDAGLKCMNMDAQMAWDAAGLYQVGHFPGYRWADWNGRYRDDMRCFVRGDAGLVGAVANRLSGSADLYQGSGRKPVNSINFINCHDGFTLNDLVSYNQKHNLANGEGNNDGNNDNMSWNCGVEGPCDDDAIKALRLQQMKNFATLLMISRGVPMFLAGDEICRTQQGNNNAYCQNNALNWFDWQLTEQNQAMLRFFRQLIQFRKSHPTLYANAFFDNEVNSRGLADVSWHGVELNQPGWDDPNARALSYTLAGRGEEADLHIMLNMYWESERFELPQVTGRKWYLALNTANPSPDDFYEEKQRPEVREGRFDVSGRSIAILVSK